MLTYLIKLICFLDTHTKIKNYNPAIRITKWKNMNRVELSNQMQAKGNKNQYFSGRDWYTQKVSDHMYFSPLAQIQKLLRFFIWNDAKQKLPDTL